MKVQLKDLMSLKINDSKKEVIVLTESQLNKLITRLKKVYDLVCEESNRRYENQMLDQIDEEIEATLTHDEVQSDEEEA